MTDFGELPTALRAHLEITYDLERPLGAGGMGIVWLATERLLDRKVAIKVLRTESASDAEAAQRFLQEARMAARLQHPGVVSLLTFGEVSGARYYVMPFVRGETLAARLARGTLGEDEARRIAAEVAEALAFVHAQGVVHRDVKPANILLDAGSGRALLTDFGIARGAQALRLTQSGMVMGTPAYLAPEQISSGAASIDGRADVYALGVVAYEMVAGAPPFRGTTPSELLAHQLSAAPVPLGDRAPAVSRAYASAVMRCLVKDPAARWPGAAQLAQELRAAREDDQDPPELREVRSVAAHALIFAPIAATISLAALSDRAAPQSWWFRAFLFLWPVGALALVVWSKLLAARREHPAKASWREYWDLAMRAPRWWFGWWPKRWRPVLHGRARLPDVVRDALDKSGRSTTWMLAVAAFAIPAIGLLSAITPEELARVQQSALWRLYKFGLQVLSVGVIAATVFTSAGAWRRALRFLKQRGLRESQISRLLGRPHDPAVLREPFVRALMDATGPAVTEPPAELRALLEDVRLLHGRLRSEGWPLDDVQRVLDDALAAYDGCEKEARELGGDADPTEGERLRARLRAFSDAGAASAEQRELRALLEQQLALHERMQRRRAEVEARRARIRAGAERVWRQLRALRAEDARHTDSGDVTGRIRAWAADVERLREGAAESRRLTGESA